MAKFSDYRVATGHLSHPKFLDLLSHPLGPLAYAAWHGLLDHCASWSPYGELGDLDAMGFARTSKLAAMSPGADFQGVFDLLLAVGLIDQTEAGHVLHDWQDHQAGIVAHAKKVAAGQKGGKTTQKRRRDSSQKCIPGEAPGVAEAKHPAKHPAKQKPSTNQAPVKQASTPSPPPSHQEGEGGRSGEAEGGDRPMGCARAPQQEQGEEKEANTPEHPDGFRWRTPDELSPEALKRYLVLAEKFGLPLPSDPGKSAPASAGEGS